VFATIDSIWRASFALYSIMWDMFYRFWKMRCYLNGLEIGSKKAAMIKKRSSIVTGFVDSVCMQILLYTSDSIPVHSSICYQGWKCVFFKMRCCSSSNCFFWYQHNNYGNNRYLDVYFVITEMIICMILGFSCLFTVRSIA